MRFEKWIRDWKTALAENFFLRSLCLLLALGLILNASFFKKRERIIIVPPELSKQFWVEQNRVSPEYLEQMGVFFAIMGGNLSPSNAAYNVKFLSNYIPPDVYSDVKTELSSQAHYIAKNNITQAFFPTAAKVIDSENRVLIEGNTVRNIGTTRISQEKMVFNVKFRVKDFKLLVEEFFIDYPEREKKKEESAEKKAERKELKQKELKTEGGTFQ
jgi:conjugal transfer pilus assembly protein TraE